MPHNERVKRYGLQGQGQVDSITKDTGAIETLVVMLNTYITHNLVPPIRGFGRLAALAVCFPIQLIALILQRILPDQGRLYLNLVIRARKIPNK